MTNLRGILMKTFPSDQQWPHPLHNWWEDTFAFPLHTWWTETVLPRWYDKRYRFLLWFLKSQWGVVPIRLSGTRVMGDRYMVFATSTKELTRIVCDAAETRLGEATQARLSNTYRTPYQPRTGR